MNTIALIGNLVADPERKEFDSGNAVTNFRIAVDRPGEDKGADFISCQAWNGQGKAVAEHLSKGARVGVSGYLRTRQYEVEGSKRTAVEVVAQRVDFLGKPSGQASVEVPPAPKDDDIPF